MRYYNNRDAARHVATNAPAPTVDGQRAGKGGAWRRSGWRRGMGDGRGNLRENREDPAPTVGRSEDAIAIQMSSHRRRHAHTVHPACHPPMGTYNLYHDAARRIATNASPPHMRMRAPPPPYAPTTRIAHINVRPHGLCSDEACRGAPRRDPPSWLPPMGTLRFFQRRGTPRRYVLREFELRD